MKLLKKQLHTSDSLPIQLQKARISQGLSVENMSERLKMNKEYIIALESGNFSQLPFSLLYQKKLIGNYAEIVGLQKNAMIQQFELEQTVPPTQKNLSFTLHTKKQWYNIPSFFRIFSVTFLALFIIGYLTFQVQYIVKPPSLELFAPLDGVIAKTSNIEVRGKTDKEVKITINGKEIAHDEQGTFQESMNLNQGVNTLIISATNKHGKSTTFTRFVIAQKNQEFSLEHVPENRN